MSLPKSSATLIGGVVAQIKHALRKSKSRARQQLVARRAALLRSAI
jgi:hypothetical protein